MTLQRGLLYFSAATALCTIVAGSWALGDKFGFRPSLKYEVEEVRNIVVAASNQLAWLRWSALDQIKQQRRLTPRECAEYLTLAKQLGIPSTC